MKEEQKNAAKTVGQQKTTTTAAATATATIELVKVEEREKERERNRRKRDGNDEDELHVVDAGVSRKVGHKLTEIETNRCHCIIQAALKSCQQ